MTESGKYGFGPKRQATRWEDLDNETRTQIVASMADVREGIAAALEPLVESVTAAVLPVLPRLSELMPQLTSIALQFGEVAEFLRSWVPNWSNEVDAVKAWAVTGEGIPLAFVPCEDIVDELLAANDIGTRREVIRRSKDRIICDCRAALQLEGGDTFPHSIAVLPLMLSETLDALQAGHCAAACALGASVVDAALRRTSDKQLKYADVRNNAIEKGLQRSLAENDFRISLSMRPLFSLFTEWYPSMRTPPPKMPSRHVIAHWADPAHLSETNGIIVAMLATSLLHGLREQAMISDLLDDRSA